MSSGSERMIRHTGTETRSRLLRDAAVGNFAQWARSLTQQRRVGEEGLWVVKPFSGGRDKTVPQESAPANSVPAAAVIRRVQALFGFTGRKGRVGGYAS